jgi:hypothetical protein
MTSLVVLLTNKTIFYSAKQRYDLFLWAYRSTFVQQSKDSVPIETGSRSLVMSRTTLLR